jgi:hypothetical protein
MKRVLFSFVLLLLFSCNAVVKESINKKYDSLPIDSKIAIVDVNQNIPDKSELLGTMRFSDSGFSTDCDFYSNLSKARKEQEKLELILLKLPNQNLPILLVLVIE